MILSKTTAGTISPGDLRERVVVYQYELSINLEHQVRILIDKKKLTFPTLIIGSGKEAADLLTTFTRTVVKAMTSKGIYP